MSGAGSAERHARRLVRCYPPAWRARYGEEFVQLLIDDIFERPRSLSRTVDVIRAGLVVRLSSAGLAGETLEPPQQLRAGLGVLGWAVCAFLAAGVAIWAHLTIGWQWSAPDASATQVGMLVMSATMVAFGLLALLAAAPLVSIVVIEFARGRGRKLLAPLVGLAAGALVLVMGGVHFGHGWPGTGGHHWAGRDVVPGGVARFSWAATLWITSYWAHPGALASFPAAEIAWMVASPAALLATVFGTARTLRRLPLPKRVLQYECWLGAAAGATMAAFLAGAGSWIVSGGPGPRGLFRVGVIDAISVVVMAGALIAAVRATQRMLTGRPPRPAPR